MKYLSKYTTSLSYSLLTTVIGLMCLASCTSSENSSDTTGTEENYDVFPKEEMLLSVNSNDTTTSDLTRSVDYNLQDSAFADNTQIGLFIIHGKRWMNHDSYVNYIDADKYVDPEKPIQKYVYGIDGNKSIDGYSNICATPNNKSHFLNFKETIYYPWGKEANDEYAGTAALVAYSPYQPGLDLLNDNPGEQDLGLTFSVYKDQSEAGRVLMSDLLIGTPDCGNPFRMPRKYVNITMKHALTKVTLTAQFTDTVSTQCDSIKIYVKNVATKANIDMRVGPSQCAVVYEDGVTYMTKDSLLISGVTDTNIEGASASPNDQVLMCVKSYKKKQSPKSITCSAIVMPGRVSNLQFDIRLYGAPVSKKTENRNFCIDEVSGAQYVQYSPKPVPEGKDAFYLGTGNHYKFLFVDTDYNTVTQEGEKSAITELNDTISGESWIVGSKQSIIKTDW